MSARKWMLGTAAAALVAASPLAGLPQSSWIAPAAAATDVSVNVDFNLFYDRLEPYGDWVSYESAYVWVPRDVSADWRPYTRGHWVYTRDYGWLWVSDEPFGWATYHYGRWGMAEDIGWYWVPAKRWAPAWVAWRRSDSHLAWAPLPPDNGVNVSININIDVDRVPRDYWVAVEDDRFLDRDIASVAIYDTRIIEDSKPVGTVVVQNNTIINNVVKVEDIERQTNKRVAVREVRSIDNPERTGKLEGDAVGVFNADIEGDGKAMKPKRSREAREVIEERKTRRVIKQPEETTGTVPQTEDQSTDTQKKRKATPEDTTGVTSPPVSKEEEATTRKKKRPAEPEETTGSVTQPSTDAEQQTTRKRKPQAGPEDTGRSVTAPAEEQPAPAKRKRKLPEDESGSLQQPKPDQNTPRKKKLPPEEAAGALGDDAPTGSLRQQQQKRQEQPAVRKQQREEGTARKRQKKCDPGQEDCG